MIYFTNSKGERLPPEINKVANERHDPDFGFVKRNKPNKNYELPISDGFNWRKSIEGTDIWLQVSCGRYQSFYEFHKMYEQAKQARKAEIIAEIEKLQNELKEI